MILWRCQKITRHWKTCDYLRLLCVCFCGFVLCCGLHATYAETLCLGKKGHFPLQWLFFRKCCTCSFSKGISPTLPPNHSMNCPSQILSTTSPRPTETQKTLQHPIPRFAMINTEFGVFSILFCLGMLAWWWHWHERNSSRPVTRRRKEICCPDFGSPGWVGIGPWKIWMPKNDLWKEFSQKKFSRNL